MKKTILLFALLVSVTGIFAQKKTTTSATIVFDATTSKDALPKAENKTVVAAIDTKSGSVAFEAIMKGFAFTNPTIQDHFNGAKWLDTDQFPSAVFKGKITDMKAINFKKNGTYTVPVEGLLTMHGKTQPVKTQATIIVNDKKLTANSAFTVNLSDYGISGGAITAGKVDNETEITVSAELN